jgi:hypothetical protein
MSAELWLVWNHANELLWQTPCKFCNKDYMQLLHLLIDTHTLKAFQSRWQWLHAWTPAAAHMQINAGLHLSGPHPHFHVWHPDRETLTLASPKCDNLLVFNLHTLTSLCFAFHSLYQCESCWSSNCRQHALPNQYDMQQCCST